MKHLRLFGLLAATLFCALLFAACTVTSDGILWTGFLDDAGATDAAADSALTLDASKADAAPSYSTCAECSNAQCASEATQCNTVKSGDQNSPCVNYKTCVQSCSGTTEEQSTCRNACGDVYPEATAFYKCQDTKCTLLCAL